MTKKITSNFYWLSISEGVGKGVVLFGNIYLAKTLGVEAYGLFIIIQTSIIYLWYAVDLGLGMYGIREIATSSHKTDKIINDLLTIRGSLGILLYTALVLFSIILVHNEETFYLIIAMGLHLIVYSFSPDWALKGLENFRALAIGGIIYASIYSIILLIFVIDNTTLIEAGLAIPVAYFFTTIILYKFLYLNHKYTFSPTKKITPLIKHVKKSIYFSLSSIATLIYHYTPIYMILYLSGQSNVAYFFVPFRIVLTLGAGSHILVMAVFPRLSLLSLEKGSEYNRIVKIFSLFMITIGVILGLSLFSISDTLILTLLGAPYKDSIQLFNHLVWLLPFYYARNAFGALLQSSKLQKQHFKITLFISILSIINSYVLVSIFGIIGAAWALLLSEIIYTALMYKKSRRILYKSKTKKKV